MRPSPSSAPPRPLSLTSGADVRNLLGDDALLNEVAPYTFKEYNTEQMLVVEHNGVKVPSLCPTLHSDSRNIYIPLQAHIATRIRDIHRPPGPRS